MTTKRKIKKSVARRERIRQQKAAQRLVNAAARQLDRNEDRAFKDTKSFFDTVSSDIADLIYRKEQIKAGLIGEVKYVENLKDSDPDKYAKLSTKVYSDCLDKIAMEVQPKLINIASLTDRFKDKEVAGAGALVSAVEAAGDLSVITLALSEIVDKAETAHKDIRDLILSIEHPETNPIAEEAKQQSAAANQEIEADPDALNKIIDAQADSKSDVVVNPLDVIKKTQLIPLTANDNEGVLLRDGIIKTNVSANLFTLSSSDVSDSSHKVDDSVKLHSVVVELSLDNDKELFELQIDQLKDAALISKPKNVVIINANVRGTFAEYEFDLTKNVKKLDGSDSVILGKLADDESIHSKLAFSAQINLDDSNIRGYGFVSFASHTDFQANVAGYTVDAYYAPALALNKPAEPLPEPPKEVALSVEPNDLAADEDPDEVIPAEADYTPETDMITTERSPATHPLHDVAVDMPAAKGNTFEDQEVEIVATPSAAKGNTNDDQEVSVDAATVNKILNEQNA